MSSTYVSRLTVAHSPTKDTQRAMVFTADSIHEMTFVTYIHLRRTCTFKDSANQKCNWDTEIVFTFEMTALFSLSVRQASVYQHLIRKL